MTTKPDLAALARELREMAESKSFSPHSARLHVLLLRAADAVLSEPAAEAPVSAYPMVTTDVRAAEADGFAWVKTRAEIGRLTAEVESLRAQLASAAPLFEAAHEIGSLFFAGNTRLDNAARDWAESEAGQRWKAERK